MSLIRDLEFSFICPQQKQEKKKLGSFDQFPFRLPFLLIDSKATQPSATSPSAALLWVRTCPLLLDEALGGRYGIDLLPASKATSLLVSGLINHPVNIISRAT